MRVGDLIAGLSVSGLMLPEAVAYAGIAGLPPQRAIFAAIVGCVVYAMLGRSRFAIVSPTSSSAAILAATLAFAPGDGVAKAGMATLIVGLAGLLFVLAGMARLGTLTGFISRPVLRGFAFGIAITIILHQLPTLVGVPVASTDLFHLVRGLWLAVPIWQPASLAIGFIALAILLALRFKPSVPGALIVLICGIAASILLDLPRYGVAVVGKIDMAITMPALPALGWDDVSRLAQFTVPLVLILFAESWGTIRSLALRHGDLVSANRELGALGGANLASALVQGMPVGAGFSAGAASEIAGSTSRWTAVAAGLGLAGLIVVGAPLISQLPKPVLAAVVIAALTHALDPMPLIRLWRIGRDQYIAAAAAVAVLAFGVLNGMLIAIALSLGAMMRRLAAPYITQLGRLGMHDYVDLTRHPEAIAPMGVAIWRPAEPLFFANADSVLNAVAARTRVGFPPQAVVLSLEESFDLDSTALDALIEFNDAMRKAGIRLQLARVHDHVRDLLEAAGAADLLAHSSYSVDDAVSALETTRRP